MGDWFPVAWRWLLLCACSGKPGKGVQVDVATGKDDAQSRRATVRARWQVQRSNDAGLQQRRERDRAGGLNNDLHAFPDQTCRRNNLFLGDQKDFFHVLAQNGEGARGKGSAQAVGNGVAGILRLQRSGGQGPVSIIGAGRFAAEDSNILSNAFGSQAGATEQTAAADWSKNGVQIRHFLEEFLGGCSLPGNNAVIIVRMNKVGAGLRLYTIARFLA